MLDGGQQKWEAIEQVIRMDHSHFPSLSDLWSALAVSGPR